MMVFRVPALLALAVLGAGVATPAAAQQYSKGYEFLDAIRKADGTKVTEILSQPGVRIINTKDADGSGALHIVAKRGDGVYLRFLLQHDADPNIQDADGNTPMMIAVENGFTEGVSTLIQYKANVNLRNSHGETPLIRAVQLRDLELVHLLLDNGADPDQPDVIAGMSARDYARADTRSPAIARVLADAPRLQKKPAAGPRL